MHHKMHVFLNAGESLFVYLTGTLMSGYYLLIRLLIGKRYISGADTGFWERGRITVTIQSSGQI